MMIFIGRNNFLLDWYSFHTFVMSICNVTSEESPENKRKKFEVNATGKKRKRVECYLKLFLTTSSQLTQETLEGYQVH